jgi:hypothetical protein
VNTKILAHGFRFCIASQQRLCVFYAPHDPCAPTSTGDVLKELHLLRRWPAGGGFYLQRHELRYAIHLAVTDQIARSDAQASVQRAALADHYIARAERSGDRLAVSWRDLGGLTGPTGADVVAPEPGVTGAAGQENALLYSVF